MTQKSSCDVVINVNILDNNRVAYYILILLNTLIHGLSISFTDVHCDCSDNNYIGTVSVTLSGGSCLRWDSLPAFLGPYTDSMVPDATLFDAADYCRNPDNDPCGPWCYRTHEEYGNNMYEYCETAACGQWNN